MAMGIGTDWVRIKAFNFISGYAMFTGHSSSFYRKEGKVTIERTLPHTITDWVGYTTCISSTHGLGIAPPTTITGFQPFFLDYSLPYSVKRGEMLHMKVSLFNYMQHSLPVSS